MASIKTIYDLIVDLLDKNNGRFITAEEATRIINISSDELYDDCIGATNKNLDKRTNVAYGKSQNTDFRLAPFRKNTTVAVVDGEATLPEDCGKITAVLMSKEMPIALRRLDEDRMGMVLNNPLREPNEDDIYYIEDNGSLQILGVADSVYIKYLKTPTPAKYVEKSVEITVGNRTVERKVFDEENSVDLEWHDREIMDIVTRVLAKLSVPVRDGFLSQQMQMNKVNE